MKVYRDKVRKQAAAYGRNPDDFKVLFLAYPIIDVSMEAARDRARMDAAEAEKHLDLHLSGISRLTGIDFSKFDLDEPLPAHLTINGHQSSLAKWIGKTPRPPAGATCACPSPPFATHRPSHCPARSAWQPARAPDRVSRRRRVRDGLRLAPAACRPRRRAAG